MINPNQKAEILRNKLIKDNKYLLAKIGGAGQDPGERKVLSEFFRYKDYINDKKWIQVTEKKNGLKNF